MGPRANPTHTIADRISAAVAAISPERFIAPERNREHGEKVIVTCDSYVKGLHTFLQMLKNESEPLRDEQNGLLSDITEAMAPRPGLPSESLDFMFNPSEVHKAQYVRLKQVEVELQQKLAMVHLVEAMIGCELQSRHTELAGTHGLVVNNDWTIVKPNKKAGHGEHSMHGMFGGDYPSADDIEGMLSGLGDGIAGPGGLRMHVVGGGNLADLLRKGFRFESSRSGSPHSHSRERHRAAAE
jgi:hypothetical protein